MYERQHQLSVLCLPNETMENRIDTPAISEEVVGQMVINNWHGAIKEGIKGISKHSLNCLNKLPDAYKLQINMSDVVCHLNYYMFQISYIILCLC